MDVVLKKCQAISQMIFAQDVARGCKRLASLLVPLMELRPLALSAEPLPTLAPEVMSGQSLSPRQPNLGVQHAEWKTESRRERIWISSKRGFKKIR